MKKFIIIKLQFFLFAFIFSISVKGQCDDKLYLVFVEKGCNSGSCDSELLIKKLESIKSSFPEKASFVFIFVKKQERTIGDKEDYDMVSSRTGMQIATNAQELEAIQELFFGSTKGGINRLTDLSNTEGNYVDILNAYQLTNPESKLNSFYKPEFKCKNAKLELHYISGFDYNQEELFSLSFQMVDFLGTGALLANEKVEFNFHCSKYLTPANVFNTDFYNSKLIKWNLL